MDHIEWVALYLLWVDFIVLLKQFLRQSLYNLFVSSTLLRFLSDLTSTIELVYSTFRSLWRYLRDIRLVAWYTRGSSIRDTCFNPGYPISFFTVRLTYWLVKPAVRNEMVLLQEVGDFQTYGAVTMTSLVGI